MSTLFPLDFSGVDFKRISQIQDRAIEETREKKWKEKYDEAMAELRTRRGWSTRKNKKTK